MRFKKLKVSLYVWLWAFFVLCFGAQAQLGDTYSLKALLPFIEQGFVTRTVWQGGELSARDPHLYYYDPQRHSEWAVLEYGVHNRQVTSFVLKWHTDMPTYLRQRIFLQTLAIYADKKLSLGQLNRLVEQQCQGEVLLKPGLYFTLLATDTHGFLKFSHQSEKGINPLSEACFAR